MFRAITLFGILGLLAGCADDSTPVNVVVEDNTAPTLPRSAAAADARVFFVSPMDGATVSSTFTVEFGLTGMDVVPAGNDTPQSGHHHLIVNAELPPFELPVPADDNYRHFGDGSSSTELSLPPGEHTLQLLLADHLHIPHEPPVYSERITVTVAE